MKIHFSKYSTPLLLVATVTAISLPIQLLGHQGLQAAVVEMLIRLVAVVGIYTFIGNTGLLSFGHVAFMSIGGYAAAWAGCDPMWKDLMLTALPDVLRSHSYGLPVSLALGAVTSGIIAFVLGFVLMRMSGIASVIATLAFLMVVFSLFSSWDSLTAGTSSVVGIPTSVNYAIALGAAVIAIAVAWAFQSSRFGLMLRATRESEPAAVSCGIRMVPLRIGVFALSAIMCGASGALYAHYVGFLSPDALYLDTTFILLSMLVIGGMYSLSGAVAGTLLVTGLIQLLHTAEAGLTVFGQQLSVASGVQQLGLAAALVAVLILRPAGIVGNREWRLHGKAIAKPTLAIET